MKQYFDLIYNKSEKEYFKYLDNLLKDSKKKFVVTVNPESLMMAEKNPELSQILLDKNNSLTPDGIAIVKKGKKYGIAFKERITGIDIATHLLEMCNKNSLKIYLFGSKGEVLDDLIKVISKKYPNAKVVGVTNGYVDNKDDTFKQIKKLQPDVCLVALGIPEQELLISKHLNEFDKGIFVGVGGSFDVLSGHKKRAPKFFIKYNLEWFYRIVCEPKRLKRFFKNNFVFMFKK